MSFEYQDFSGGLNDSTSPVAIADNELTDIQNFCFTTTKALVKRTGFTHQSLDASGNPVTFASKPVRGLYLFNRIGYSKSLIAVCNGAVYADKALTKVFASLDTGYTETAIPDFATLNNVGVMVNGVEVPKYIKDTGALSMGSLAGSPTMANAKYLAVYNNYLFMAGGATNPSRIVWSVLNNPESWQAADYIDINVGDGDLITGLKVIGSDLYVFKSRSIYRVTFTGVSTTPFTVSGNPAIESVGAFSHRTIQTIERTCFFFSGNAVYEFDGVNIKEISNKIETNALALATPYNMSASAGILRTLNQYWLSITTSGQTRQDTIFVYDYMLGAWTKYAGIYANGMAEVVDNNNQYWLYTGQSNSTGGGYVYRQNDGNSDIAAAINAYAVTKWMDHGKPESRKRYKKLYVYATSGSAAYNLVVNTYFDFQTAGDAYTFNLQSGGVMLGTFVVNVNQLGSATAAEYSTYLNTKNGKRIQLRFTQNGAAAPVTIYGYSLSPRFREFKQ
jgi:hypothetical protein